MSEPIITDNGREFCGKDTHPYQRCLDLNDIEHRRTRVRRPQTNGFVDRFNNTVLNEFVPNCVQNELIKGIATWANVPLISSIYNFSLSRKKPS
ncbi:MAG: transposase family protein [Desulfofustis sp.]|nr:transposase family protein [Desulfofustis sp.]